MLVRRLDYANQSEDRDESEEKVRTDIFAGRRHRRAFPADDIKDSNMWFFSTRSMS